MLIVTFSLSFALTARCSEKLMILQTTCIKGELIMWNFISVDQAVHGDKMM